MAIPKIIHFCWFGRGDKPQDVLYYIEGWRRVLPDYQIIEWNEDNFNIKSNRYVEEAYNAKKYAFVSDYARLFALYNHGGIYLDTDVEVFKVFDDLLNNDVILGFEEKNYVATSTICASKQSQFIKKFMNTYNNKCFISPNGELDLTTNVTKITKLLEQYGLITNGEYQKIEGPNTEKIIILDRFKLSPYDYLNQIDHSNESTYAIHHFGATWASSTFKYKKLIKSFIIKLIGSKNYKKLSELLK
ncbi:MAG: glycosyl transferase [Colwellia sp.]|nr:glycosyl transferase [Colwellia sp.]